MRPAENTAGVCNSCGIGADDLDPCNLLQFADLLHGEIGLARHQPFRGKARRNNHGAGVDLGAMPIRSINCANRMPLAPIRE